MEPLTLEAVAAATDGETRVTDGATVGVARRVVTDSRWVRPGDLFVCLEGPNFDGHRFAADAVEDGAVAVLAHKPVPAGVPAVMVADTLAALGRLAKHVRGVHDRALVVGVTGTNGKTSTKDLTAAALESAFATVASERSYNNAIGLPLTLLGMNADTRAVVVELGTNGPGEIAHLTDLAQPEVGVITNIDKGHLAGLRSVRGVRREKAALLEGLQGRQIAILNRDDPQFDWLAERAPGSVVSFGTDPRADLCATDVHCTAQGTSFVVDGSHQVQLRLLGRHAVSNALAALAVACAAGVGLQRAVGALGRVLPAPGRLQVRALSGLTVIDDSYNANPGSLGAALRTVSELRWPGRLLVVLGDMLELGEHATALHRQAGELVATAAPARFVAVGGHADELVEGALHAGLPAGVCHSCTGWEDAAESLLGVLRRGDVVLVKGSRGLVLDKLVARLAEMEPVLA